MFNQEPCFGCGALRSEPLRLGRRKALVASRKLVRVQIVHDKDDRLIRKMLIGELLQRLGKVLFRPPVSDVDSPLAQ